MCQRLVYPSEAHLIHRGNQILQAVIHSPDQEVQLHDTLLYSFVCFDIPPE
jgi:hypothetical protein